MNTEEYQQQWGKKDDPTISDHADNVVFRVSQRIQWTTEQEYRKLFGEEPPTAKMMKALATVWKDHKDFRIEWQLGI